MNKISVYIKFFGEFRKFGEGVELEVSCRSSVAEIKVILGQRLGAAENELVKSSVLANDDMILHDEFLLEQNTRLAVLPPVCGG